MRFKGCSLDGKCWEYPLLNSYGADVGLLGSTHEGGKNMTKSGPALEGMLGIKHPILLGGMSGICDHVLASAVSEAGGLGTLAGAMQTGDTISDEIEKLRNLTDKPFAVNIPIAYYKAGELVDAVIKEGVRVVITAAGNPGVFTGVLKAVGITVIHVVPTPDFARKAEEAGVDAVIAEGFESGGMASKFEIGTLALVPQVVDAVRIPVVAAGGIADARGYLAARALGAAGVSLGTAFLASRECRRIGSPYKELLINSEAMDTAIVARGVHAVRALKNEFYYAVEKKMSERAGKEEIINYIFSSRDLTGGKGILSCGQGVGLIREIMSAREIIEGITEGAEAVLRRLTEEITGEPA